MSLNIPTSIASLDDAEGNIVIPSWACAVFGLYDGNVVHLLLTEPTNERPGEFLFSSLNLSRWSQHVRVVIHSPIGRLSPFSRTKLPGNWNVMLSESSFIDDRISAHEAFLVDENNSQFADGADRLAELSRCLARHGERIEVAPFGSLRFSAWWATTATMQKGRLIFDKDKSFESWEAMIQAQLALLSESDVFDSSRYLVSLDTKFRMGSIVFPRKGARSVNVEFDDKPGGLSNAIAAIRSQGWQILTSFIRRPTTTSGRAILVATLEPSDDTHGASASSLGDPQALPCVFISHPHADSRKAFELHSLIDRAFAGRLQVTCTSLSELPSSYSDDLFGSLGRRIRESDLLLLLVTPNTPTRAAIAWELTYARRNNVDIVFCKLPRLPVHIADEARQLVNPKAEITLGKAKHEAFLIDLISQKTKLTVSGES